MLKEDIIKQKFDKDCKILVEGILGAMDKAPEAILLCGGYGRGEGAWFEDENGNPTPYNDYDVAVITEKPLSREKYKVLRKDLASEIGINWVDIDCYTQFQLTRMRPTIHNVDLFYASTLLWGDKNWNQNRTLNPKKIGKGDITRLYYTRMWTFLGPITEKKIDLDIVGSRFFCNQMAKAVLAGCDMRLVAKHQYTTSYKERVRIVCDNYLKDERFKELCCWAIKEKLSPSSKLMTSSEVMSLYDKAYSFFVDSFTVAMGREALNYLNPDRTKKHLLCSTDFIIQLLYGRIRGNKNIKKSYDIKIAQNYVFRAYSPSGEYNHEYLARASSILMNYNYIDAPIQDWRKLCLIVANARNNV